MVSILVLAIGAGLMAAVARVCWLLAMVGRASKRRSSGDKLRTIAVLGSGINHFYLRATLRILDS
eukprot:1393452-Amorphochlora_amoeboformis.AAC.2